MISIKNVLVLVVLIGVVFLSGCDKVKISFYTEIFKDGSAYRKVQYAYTPLDEGQLKYFSSKLPEIFQKGFVLPDSPDWSIQKYANNKTFYYVAEKNFSSINDLKSDYYKKSSFNGASQNFASFDYEEKSNFVEFNFLEAFKDSADIVVFANEFYSYIDVNQNQIAQKLFKYTNNYINDFKYSEALDIVKLFIDKTYQFRNKVNEFHVVGPYEKKEIFQELKKLDSDIKMGDFVDHLESDKNNKINSKLFKLFHIEKANLSSEQKRQLLEDLKKLVREEFKSVSLAHNIDPLGAYYTQIDMFNGYSFEYTLKMPGVITNSNGNRINENTVQWTFEPGDFFNHDYFIISRSKLDD